MIPMRGDNIFPDNIYDAERWSAPVIQMPEELAAYFRSAGIAGRRISRIHMVGPGYNFSQEWMLNFALSLSMAQKDPEKAFPPVIDFIPPDEPVSRLALVDKPVIIEFDTGDSLAVLFDRGSEVRVALNSLPKDLISGPEAGNVDPDVLFSEALDKRVLGIQVGRRKELPEGWVEPRGEDWKTQETLIAFLMFQLEGGVGLAFEPYRETGRVFLIGSDKKIRTIPFGELRPALTLAPLMPEQEPEKETKQQ
jgi:hypothetical protein